MENTTPQKAAKPLMTSISQAASMLGVCKMTIYRLINSGAVKAVKCGSRTLIPTRALDEYIEALPPFRLSTEPEQSFPQSPQPDAYHPGRILRAKQVAKLTGPKRSTIYMRAEDGTFPKRIALGGSDFGWREAEVKDWLANPADYKATS